MATMTKEELAEHSQIEAMFGDRNTFLTALPEPERVSALAYIDENPEESEERRMWMANVKLFAKQFKMPTEQVVEEYDGLQMAYVAQVLGEEPREMAPAEFHGRIKERITKRRDMEQPLNELADKLTEDYMGEKRPDFDAAMKKRLAEMDPDGTKFDAQTRAVFRDAASRRWFKMSESDLVTREAIAAAADYFVKGRDTSYTGISTEQQRAVDALSKLDEDDQRFAINRAASLSRVQRDEAGAETTGWWARLNKMSGRSVADVARGGVAAAVDLGIDVLRKSPAVQGEAGKTGKPVPTSEEVYARMEKEGLGWLSPRRMDIERRLSSALAGKADAVDTGNWASTALLLAGSNLPRMAIALNPVGMALNAAAYSKETEGELLDRGVPPAWAKGLGRVGAPIMAAIDFAQAGIAFKGWVPGGKGLVGKFASQVGKTLAVAGVQGVEQIGQELAQDAVAPILQAMAGEFNAAIPGVNVVKEVNRLKKNAPDAALGMLPYILVGTGRARWKDQHAEKLYLQRKEFITASGYSAEVARDVLKAPTAEAAKEILREANDARDMTTPAAREAQADIAEQMGAASFSHEAMADGTPALDTALEPRWRDDGMIELVDAGGTVVDVASSPFEAAEIALRYQKNYTALERANAWVESRNEMPEGTTIEVWEMTPPVEGAQPIRTVTVNVMFDPTATDPNQAGMSMSPEQAREAGYNVPAVPASLPQGQYKAADLRNGGDGVAPPAGGAQAGQAPQGQPNRVRLVQEEIPALREAFPEMQLEDLPEPDREKVLDWLDEAKRPGANGRSMVQDAGVFAQALLVHPRAMTKLEQAAMVVRTAQLRNEYRDALSDAAASVGNVTSLKSAMERAARAKEEYDTVTRAAKLGGTELGRGMAARRWLAVDLETYDLVSIVNRIEAYKGGEKIDPETLATLKKTTDDHKEVQTKIEALTETERKAADKQQAEDVKTFVKEAKEGKRPASRKRKDKKKPTREELIEELKKLGYDPVNGGEITPAVADVIAKLGEFHVEAGAKTLSDIDGRVKEDVPAISEDQIHRAFSKKIAEEAEPKARLEDRVAEFRKQAGLWADIHAIMDSGKVEKGGEKPLASEKVEQLREILAKLRLAVMKTELDDAKLAELQTKFNELQDRITRGLRSVPEKKNAPRTTDAIKQVEAGIRDLERKMSVEDSIFDLEDRIRRAAPPSKKRHVEENDELFMLHRKRLELRRQLARIEEAQRPLTFWRGVGATAEFMRATKATADFSAAFRQAVVLAPRQPVVFGKAFGKAFKAFFSSEYADRLDFEIRRQPQHIWRERAGLFLSNVDSKMTGREESFTSSAAERMWGVGSVVRGSNRNMVTMLNLMRVATFDAFREANPDANIEVMNAMARYVNVASGRGDLRQLESVAGVLSKLAFSPRFVASRFQMLGSPFYFAAKYQDKRVAKEASKDMLAFLGAGMGVLLLASLAGAEVGTDPEDSFFGKMRFGPMVVDLWGGLQQPLALMLKASVATADNAGVIDANKDINVMDAGLRFLAYKASPGISGSYAILTGEDIVGRDVGFVEAVVKSVTPITLETVWEAGQASNWEDPGMIITATTLNSIGVGVQVYEDKKKKGKAKLRKVD